MYQIVHKNLWLINYGLKNLKGEAHGKIFKKIDFLETLLKNRLNLQKYDAYSFIAKKIFF